MPMLRVALAGLIMFAGIAMFQNRLLYFPDTARVDDLVSTALRAWPSPDDFRGLVAEPAGPVRGTVIVFHGNAGHAGHREYYATALTPLGLRVILAEYPGYGPRSGELGEASLVSDAATTITLAREHYGGPLLLIGESLGSGVVAAASETEREPIAGMMLITPWDRLENVASYHYPWLPVRWLLRDTYDSAAHLADSDRPVLVVVAKDDRIVPARFGIALHDALTAPKRLSVVPAAAHNDWVEHVDARWWREAMDFLLRESH